MVPRVTRNASTSKTPCICISKFMGNPFIIKGYDILHFEIHKENVNTGNLGGYNHNSYLLYEFYKTPFCRTRFIIKRV
jgi:hypothetical protein